MPTAYKSFRYKAKTTWTSARRGLLSAVEKTNIAVGSPPEFKGELDVWTPEELLVGSLNTCIMLTFLSLAQARGLTPAGYESEAEGLLENVEGKFRITEVTVRPHVTVRGEGELERAREIMERAESECFISNSVNTLTPRRQMIEAEEVSADGLTWTFRLRPGLRFHDGEPVLAKDAVASINRWAAREPMGQMIKAIENELVAIDDRTFRWILRKPYPKIRLALGKTAPPCCFVMPARIAATDAFRQIGEYVGSGPMRFMRNEWVPGAKAVFEKFADYAPRQEPPSWFAGGKNIVVNRIEWITIPDPATAAAALQNGEVDWLELVLPDLLPILRKNRNLMTAINDPVGSVGALVMNHLYPPFNDVRARRAILMALSQEDYMRAHVGDDDSLWKPMPGYFPPGTPLYTEEGGDILKGPRKVEAAKRLLAESGYAGEPVTVMAAQDLAHFKAWGDVTVDLLKRLDMKVDFAAVDWGTLIARRIQKSPPRQGGWQMFITGYFGVEFADPSNRLLRANGNEPPNGWANNPQIEAEIAAWYDATSLVEEKTIVRRLNRLAVDYVVYAPLGAYLRHYAWRKNVSGIVQAPLPLFWGVTKTA